jgi:hypothetical protein
MLELTAKVKTILKPEIYNQGKENEFKKQCIIVETLESQKPFKLEFTNKDISLLDGLLLGVNIFIEYYLQNNYDPTDKTKVYYSTIAKSLKQF